MTCDAGGGPLFVAADVRLDPVSSANLIVDARALGGSFSLPTDGTTAQTSVALSSGMYTSPLWKPDGAGNQVLTGMHGPAIVAADAHFGWLDFLTTNWESFFDQHVSGMTMGHLVESPAQTWTTNPVAPYKLKTHSDVVYIGYSPATGAYLRGELGSVRADPGCFGG